MSDDSNADLPIPTESAPDLADAGSADDNSIGHLLREAMQATDSEQSPEPAEQRGADGLSSRPATATDEDGEPEPPQSLTAAERAAWANLPATAKEIIQRREKDFQKARFSDSKLGEVLEPLRNQLEGSGVHVDEYVQGLLQADRYVSEQPLQAIMAIAQRHNLTDELKRAFSSESDSSPSYRDDDAMAEVKKLRQELRYQQELSAAQQEWQRFVAENPDADRLKKLIAAELSTDSRASYREAYERAKQLVTESAGSVRAAEERQRVESGSAASSKARKLSLPRGRSGTQAEAASSGNLRQDIADAMRRAGLMS